VRIVSLLPSATEIVYALGLEADLVGVTHECDWPPAALDKQVVSHTTLPPDATASEIDALVSASAAGGDPTYSLDAAAVRALRPDLVITQDLCQVCAVPSGDVKAALDVIGCDAEVVSLDPTSLGDVLDGILRVAKATGADERGDDVVAGLRARLEAVRRATSDVTARPRTFALEWGDPPFNGGHWVPEMIDIAGGECILGAPGVPSTRLTWESIAAAAPDVVVFMPCGYDLDAACEQAGPLLEQPALAAIDSLLVVDANAHFSRPGPRLVDGVEILAAALHPDRAAAPVVGGVRRYSARP
jgi:iron complex transport system substrate-binding protein